MRYIEDVDQAAGREGWNFYICLGLQVVILSEISAAMQPFTTKKTSCASFAHDHLLTSSDIIKCFLINFTGP